MPDRADLDALKRANAALEAKLNRLLALKQDCEKKEFEARKQDIKAFCEKAVKDKKMRDLIFSGLEKDNPDLELLKSLAKNQAHYKKEVMK